MAKFSRTTCYHQHTLCLPVFVKKAFKEMKTFFCQKTLSSSFFLKFPNWKFADFLFKKSLMIRAGKTILQNSTIWYAFYSKFATFSDFEKKIMFFLEKPIYFSKKTQNFEKSYYLSYILQQIWWKKIHVQ